jgi:ABC-type transport system involved in cytochrome c biogenesis permease component
MTAGILSRVWAVAAKDAAQELRRRIALASVFFFAATSLTLVSFAIGPLGVPAEARESVSSALLWIILFFSAATGLPRAYVR